MGIYKRGQSGIYWIAFTDATGRRVQRSAGTTDRQAAQELHDQLKAEAWRRKNLGEKPRRWWKEAAVRWIKEKKAEGKRSVDHDLMHLRWLDPHLRDLRLDEITEELIAELRDLKLSEGVTEARANRIFATLRGILRRAEVKWKWLDRAPHVAMTPERGHRVRWLTQEDADRLIEAMPKHMAEMARFSLATGLRMSNVLGLEWKNVDLERECCWVQAQQAKGKRAIAVPLNADALACLRRQIGQHPRWVFTYRGGRQKRIDTKSFHEICRRAGIEDFRWHDLRHTWASWHVQNGTPLHVLKDLGGWADLSMVQRYAHLSPGHLAEFAANISGPKPKLRSVK